MEEVVDGIGAEMVYSTLLLPSYYYNNEQYDSYGSLLGDGLLQADSLTDQTTASNYYNDQFIDDLTDYISQWCDYLANLEYNYDPQFLKCVDYGL